MRDDIQSKLGHQTQPTIRPNSLPVPLVDLKTQYASIRGEVRAAIDRVLDSQQFILGPEVEALEKEIADYSQCRFGIGVSSGTDALLVALMAIGIEKGDEVITTPYTFFATAGTVARLGAKPVFADIDPQSFNINPASVEAVVTEHTRAIIPVHLFGQIADMDPIMDLARRRDLYVIEDAAQAIGAEYKGRRAGSMGHLGCFSFFPSKNLGGAGDAGMVVTNDPQLAQRIRLLRSHGAMPKYHHQVVGGNFRLDAIQAAVLRVKLKYLESWNRARRNNAATYRRLFQESGLVSEGQTMDHHRPGLILPYEASYGRHVYNQFVIRNLWRDDLAEHLKECHIGTEVYYPVPMHLQECFAERGYHSGDFPASEQAARDTLALPIYPELSKEMLSNVVNSIAGFYAAQTLE